MDTEDTTDAADRPPAAESETSDVGEGDRPSRSSAADGRSPSPTHGAGGLPGVRGRWHGRGRWQRAAFLVAVCFALLTLVNAFLVQPFQIPSGSMENTLKVGDRVLVDKLAYRFGGHPQRGDVIVFDGAGSFTQDTPPADNPAAAVLRAAGSLLGFLSSDQDVYVKRVVGVGGDRVTCCDARGRRLVNGRPVDEGYLYPEDAPSEVAFDIVVPPGRLWVMGDHRSVSRDSRDHLGDPGGGTVPVDEVIGRAEWIVWPGDRMRVLDHPKDFAAVPAPAVGGAHG